MLRVANKRRKDGENVPSNNDLFINYLKTIDNIQELVSNNAELDIELIIRAGKKPNKIIVPTVVMDKPADYSKPVCGTVKLTAETIRFKHNISPQMIEKGFTYFKKFVNDFRREIEKRKGVKICRLELKSGLQS